MRKMSVSTTFTVYHDGRFWVGVVERAEGGMLSAAPSTKSQQAIAQMREQGKAESKRRRAEARREAEAVKFALRAEKRRRKRRGR